MTIERRQVFAPTTDGTIFYAENPQETQDRTIRFAKYECTICITRISPAQYRVLARHHSFVCPTHGFGEWR